MNDRNCETTQDTFRDYRLATNLYIVLDGSWPYLTVYPAISHLIDVIEVNKFGSSITLLSAADGSIVVNKTFSLADFHTEYTLTKHQASAFFHVITLCICYNFMKLRTSFQVCHHLRD